MSKTWLLLLVEVCCGQRLKEYNLWVCPHCERGVKVADVTDLSCEVQRSSDGVDWPWVKQAMKNFLTNLVLPPAERTREHEVDKLLDLASAPMQGECYLGIIALGFFAYHFMETSERQHFIRTSVFGGVTFQKTVPLSYWDVYTSGWPIFGLLATAAETVQSDAMAGHGSLSKEDQADVGLTGIDLGPRNFDFPGGPATKDDQNFMTALQENLGGTRWLSGQPSLSPLPLRTALGYLAQTSYRKCSWGRAAAYFAAAEGMLASSTSLSLAVWNSTKALMALGEQNLDGCESNMTVYHEMQSVWPFWQILGRLEKRHLYDQVPDFVPALPSPPALPAAVRLKWQHLLHARQLKVEATFQPAAPWMMQDGAGRECLEETKGVAHIALSADLAQIDGLIVTLSSSISATADARRLCFHTFVLEQQQSFMLEALQCAFGDALKIQSTGLSGQIFGAFTLGEARLLIHSLDPETIWREVCLNSSRPGAVMLGETDLSNSLRSDTGNLGAVHNFARFSLHQLLPHLSRVVYLDEDVVVKGDLLELFHVSMSTDNGAPGTVAAVQRKNQPLRTYVDVLQPAVPHWLPSEAPSFNAGVMVIDLNRWRQRHASQLVAEWIAMNARRRLWLHGSQPPLLLLFHDEVVSLHWSWNVDGLGHRLNYPKNVLNEAKVLHWTGPLKPWRHHGVNRLLWEPHTREYCPRYSFREHTTTCRPDSWFC